MKYAEDLLKNDLSGLMKENMRHWGEKKATEHFYEQCKIYTAVGRCFEAKIKGFQKKK